VAEPTAPLTFRIYPGFAVPFAEVEFPEPRVTNAELRALFLEREGEGDAYRNPNPTVAGRYAGFESRFDVFQWPEGGVVRLREFCVGALYRLIAELNGYGREQLQDLRMSVDAWFHVTRRGAEFGLHNHPMASWSGVYCVDNGYGDGEAQSGELVFQHPAPTAGMFIDLGVANIKTPWAIGPRTYRLRPGQLVLFPSWVLHQVMPYHGPGERITVAFNAWFRKAA